MNTNEIMDIVTSSVSPAISSVGTIVGTLITALLLRRNTSSAEFEKIKAGKFDTVIEDLLDAKEITYLEYYKTRNFMSIAKKADDYYSKNLNKQKKIDTDFDWFVDFFESAGKVSDEQMQEIWAKILTGELSSSGSFSKRTINILGNMGKKDAELFNSICSHSFISSDGRVCLPHYNEYLKQSSITYDDILKMNELGLMFNDGTIRLDVIVSNIPAPLISNRTLVTTVFTEDKDKKISLSQYPFTQSGTELASLVGDIASDDRLIEYTKQLIEHEKTVQFEVHKMLKRCNDGIEIDDNDLLKKSTGQRIDI